MSLVCKEFVASRLDDDDVVILSEFADAAVQLSSAILVNPYSHKSMDQALGRALSMAEEERRIRMKALADDIRSYDIRAWANAQMQVFDQAGGDGKRIRVA